MRDYKSNKNSVRKMILGIDSKVRVIQVGPSPRGVGGIETVIRTYLHTEWKNLKCEVLETWDKTAPTGRKRGLVMNTVFQLFRMRLSASGPDVVHVHLSHRGSFLREGLIVILANKLGYVTVATIHGSAFVVTSREKLWRFLYPKVLRRAHTITVLNRQAQKSVEDMRLPVTTMIAANPGPLGSSEEAELKPGESEPVVLFAGTVGVRKGVDTLLRAWPMVEAKVPTAKLRIWGPVEDSMRNSEGKRHFMGSVTAEEVSQQLRLCRVAVLPSTAEAMPMFVLEAMGAGRPCVVTDVGAMPEQIGGGGIVVPVGDPGRLAEALLQYLESEELATNDGFKAKQRYDEYFSLEGSESTMESIYDTAKSAREASVRR